jgi:hypothetical protein
VEVLEAKGTSGPGFGFFPGLEPDSFAELVGRDLPRPAEIAVQFEAQPLLVPAGVGPQELPGGPGIPALALPPAGALGDTPPGRRLGIRARPGTTVSDRPIRITEDCG